MYDCRKPKNGNAGKLVTQKPSGITKARPPSDGSTNLMDFLLSSDSVGGDVRMINVVDRGSKSRYGQVDVHGAPARCIIDSSTSVTLFLDAGT